LCKIHKKIVGDAQKEKMSLERFNEMGYFTSIVHLIIIDVQFTRVFRMKDVSV
jgi:hypothetical protein